MVMDHHQEEKGNDPIQEGMVRDNTQERPIKDRVLAIPRLVRSLGQKRVALRSKRIHGQEKKFRSILFAKKLRRLFSHHYRMSFRSEHGKQQ